MRKYFLLIIFLGSVSFSLTAQFDPQYTQFMHNKLAINPAYAGSKEVMTFTALYRNQWAGIAGAPKTYSLQAHTPFFDNRCGAGLSIVGDQHGFYQTYNIGLNYAYRMPMGDGATMSIGLTGKMEYGQIDFSQSDPLDTDDEEIGTDNTRMNPNFGIGAFYSHPQFYVGLSAPNLMRTVVFTDTPDQTPNINRMRSYYLMGGLIMPINGMVKFKPAALLTFTPNAPFDMNLNASFLFMDRIWAGISYRWGDSVDALFQYEFSPQLKAGFAFDITTSELSQYSTGSFEVMLNYSLDFEGKNLNHLRYF